MNNLFKELSVSELTEIYGGERSFWENVGFNARVLVRKVDEALNDWAAKEQEWIFQQIESGTFNGD